MCPSAAVAFREEDWSESIPSSGLSWSGATADQLDFMRSVYDAHVARSAARRAFISDLPSSVLSIVEGSQRMRTPAATQCHAMLEAARTAMTPPVTAVGITSGYRPASAQFGVWERNFPTYYNETASHRAALSGGEHGSEAVRYMVAYVGARVAAPGFSLHNDGRAADLFTIESGHRLAASSKAANIAAWERSWFWSWLNSNAATYSFFQNTSIREPWHWEYRGTMSESDEAEDEAFDEQILLDVGVSGGQEVVFNVPLLASHRGAPPDLVLKWNDMTQRPASVDVAVHLHGYSRGPGAEMRLTRDKLPMSGLDFYDPANPMAPGRTRPTLFVLPRGNYVAETRNHFTFPALTAPGGMQALIDFALARFGAHAAIGSVAADRVIITAHSGGTKALLDFLRHREGPDPIEIHVFDGMYWAADPLIEWATRHISADLAGAPAQPGALRVFYRPETQTEAQSLRLKRAVEHALGPNADPRIAARYRVEPTRVAHNDIPGRFGWQLFRDAGANVT